MATLTIRNLPDEIRDKLRIRAAENGRSMEAEARNLLTDAVSETSAELSEDEYAQRIAQVQEELRSYVPAGVNLVDDFLAGRRRMWGEE